MPHTNRKKKPNTSTSASASPSHSIQKRTLPQPSKRIQVSDDAGWTHIISTTRSARAGKDTDTSTSTDWTQGGDFVIQGVAYVQRSVDEMGGDLEFFAKGFEGDVQPVRALVSGTGRVSVQRVVCLGLGSLQSARREGRRASFVQLVALRVLIEELGITPDKCVFQDPQFTDNDRLFLEGLGYKVVQDPLAFEHVGEDTLVYAIHCYADIYKRVAAGPRPAVLIGTNIDNFGRFNLAESVEEETRALEEMVSNCETCEFPQTRYDFSDTKVYWRRAGDGVTVAAAADAIMPESMQGDVVMI